MYLEGRGSSFIGEYIDIAKKLKNAGANIIAMCCNTAHFAIDEIKQQINVPFINVIEEVVLETKNSGAKKIALIASDGCLKGNVYERYFDLLYPEITLIYPDINLQKEVTRGICNIKNKNRFLDDFHPDRPKNIFRKVVEHLEGKGAEKVIIGCTDIRVDYEDKRVIDSLEVLTNKIINEFENGK
jgi:aspartate racemase